MTSRTTISPRLDALDVFVELLAEADAPAGEQFYDRLCEGVCRLSAMRRVVLFLYDAERHRVRAVGSHGVPREGLGDVHATLEETPIAQRALADDRVVEIAGGVEAELPPPYRRFLPITSLACTPVAAGGHAFGVILADRGGEPFTLTEDERHALWSLGKVAALAASARNATRQQERARRLTDRLDLARDVHERVVQRVFGVSLVLRAERGLSAAERARAGDELREALADLRDALRRPLAAEPRPTRATLREELDRLRERAGSELPIEVNWADGVELPPEAEPVAQSVLGEAIRNVGRHARPRRVQVTVERADGAVLLEVANDGVVAGSRGTGMGLRLAAFEALAIGGTLEWGAPATGEWRLRLALPDQSGPSA